MSESKKRLAALKAISDVDNAHWVIARELVPDLGEASAFERAAQIAACVGLSECLTHEDVRDCIGNARRPCNGGVIVSDETVERLAARVLELLRELS